MALHGVDVSGFFCLNIEQHMNFSFHFALLFFQLLGDAEQLVLVKLLAVQVFLDDGVGLLQLCMFDFKHVDALV